MTKRITQLIRFLEEIEQLQRVKRVIYYKDGSQENSAEHSWHVSMFVMILGSEVDPKADTTKMLKMALIHDLVEVYAGDTFLFDDKGREDKQEREYEAAKKLFAMLPSDRQKEFWELFEEFENLETREAKIVKSFDHLQPLIHNLIHDGSTWKRHGLSSSQHDKKKRPNMIHNKKILRIYETSLQQAYKRKLFVDL